MPQRYVEKVLAVLERKVDREVKLGTLARLCRISNKQASHAVWYLKKRGARIDNPARAVYVLKSQPARRRSRRSNGAAVPARRVQLFYPDLGGATVTYDTVEDALNAIAVALAQNQPEIVIRWLR